MPSHKPADSPVVATPARVAGVAPVEESVQPLDRAQALAALTAGAVPSEYEPVTVAAPVFTVARTGTTRTWDAKGRKYLVRAPYVAVVVDGARVEAQHGDVVVADADRVEHLVAAGYIDKE